MAEVTPEVLLKALGAWGGQQLVSAGAASRI